jgi:hypothetical protein
MQLGRTRLNGDGDVLVKLMATTGSDDEAVADGRTTTCGDLCCSLN